MRKVKKSRIMVFMIIVLVFIFAIISCNNFVPWDDVIEGVGIWGNSRYGKAVFGEEKKGAVSEELKSLNNKEDINLWK